MPKLFRFLLPIAAIALLGWFAYSRIYAHNPFVQFGAMVSQLFPRQAAGQLQGSGQPIANQGSLAPEFAGIGQWFNTPDGQPLTLADLRGKVVIVDFWTFSCINCIRNIPYVTAWDRKYREHGLVIVGVHTPEFRFEREPAKVEQKVTEYGIRYPVAMDNNYATWNAFNNSWWPAKYFINHRGELVGRHIGEGDYEATERTIQQLLRDAGTLADEVALEGQGVATDFSRIDTPEIYLGYRRINNFDGPVTKDREATFGATPATVPPNTFFLEGTWFMGPESVSLRSSRGSISITYTANKANLVLRADAPVVAEVRLDGKPLTATNKGGNVELKNGKSWVTIQDDRLYNLTNTGTDYGQHLLQLIFTQPGVEAFAFTFG